MAYRRNDDVDEFLSLCVRSALIDREQLDRLLESYHSEYLPATASPDMIAALCSHLISREALTAWQCEKLRHGQWKGFFLDRFKLLDDVGYDGKFSYFLAQDTQARGYVKIAITPWVKTKGTDIEYRVVARLD